MLLLLRSLGRMMTQSIEQHPRPFEHECTLSYKELHALARAFVRADLSRDEFIAAVLRFESERVGSLGFTLVGSHPRDDWTHFSLRHRGSCTVYASFEFLAETGEFRNEFLCH